MNEIRECAACGSHETVNTDSPIIRDKYSKYSVLKCKKCDLHWSDPMPTTEEMDTHYGKYYKVRYSTVDKSKFKTNIRKIITFRKLRLKNFFRHIEKHSPHKSILDFGCGEADILFLAKKKSWKVLGVDYSNELGSFLKNKGIDFKQANNLYDAGISENSFGCISAKHTIEHLTNLKYFFDSVKKFLMVKGVLAIKTPSSTSMRAKLGLADWHYVKPPEHCWGFNLFNFKLLAERNGFEVIYIKDNLLVDELTCIAIKK